MASSSGEGTRWKICSGGEDRPGRPSGPSPRGQPEELRRGRPSSESQREREKGNRTVLEEPGGQVTETTLSVLQGRGQCRKDTKRVRVPEVCSKLLPSLPGSLCCPPSLSKGHWGHTWWLGDDDHIAGQPDVTGSAALEWDG